MIDEPLYQVAMLGAGAASFGAPLTAALNVRLDEIGVGLSKALRVLGAAEMEAIDPTAPLVAVYFGGDKVTDHAAVSQLLSHSTPVLPVVANLKAYTESVPPALKPINGLALDPHAPDMTALANLVLEDLALLRRTRRLFLSYRQSESSDVAQQLRIAFDGQGYDAFLDTNSVPKGDDFQAVLWHRLLDSDVLVVLDTPDFLGSKYTQLEIAQALAMSVGMLHVLWPGVVRAPYAALAVPLQLDSGDFAGSRLTAAAESRILKATEALRARCMAARHTNLIVEFCEEADRIGVATAVQPGRFVIAELGDRRIVAIPAVGVLDARRYHEASTKFDVGGKAADEAVLIYDHRGMLPEWTVFLDWLDEFLPVKGLRVTDTAARLGEPA